MRTLLTILACSISSAAFAQSGPGPVPSPWYLCGTNLCLNGVVLNGFLYMNGTGASTIVLPGTGIVSALQTNVGTAGAPVVNGGALGTPSSGTGTHITGLPIGNVVGLGTGVATALGIAVGSAGAPIVNGGVLGTPSSGNGANLTGIPSTGLSGLGTGVATALGVAIGSAGAPVVNGGALGTPSSGTATNITGLPIAGLTGLGAGVATALGHAVNTASGLATYGGPAIFANLTVGSGSLTYNAVSDMEVNGPYTIQSVEGWQTAYARWGYQLTSTSSQTGSFTGCDVNGSTSTLAEYDCVWFMAVADSHGTAVLGTDVVGERDEAFIPGTNITGAGWAGIDYAVIDTGGDGQLIGREIDITNNGLAGTAPINAVLGGAKLGMWVGANGTASSSAAFALIPGSLWQRGFWASANGLTATGTFAELDDSTGAPLYYVDTAGEVTSTGTRTRTGQTGSWSNDFYNIYWTGSAAHLWIDSTDLGAITVTSDPRVKHNINSMSDGALDHIMQLRPVTFNWNNVGVFHDDHKLHEGFLTTELGSIIPDAVVGEPGAVNVDGSVAPQSVNMLSVVAELTKSVQELKKQLDEVKHECVKEK